MHNVCFLSKETNYYMLKLYFLTGIFVLTFSSCGSSEEEVEKYPYYCSCNCIRCGERDPDTFECIKHERKTFPALACAATDEDADDACAEECERFGTECTWEVVEKASDIACQPVIIE